MLPVSVLRLCAPTTTNTTKPNATPVPTSKPKKTTGCRETGHSPTGTGSRTLHGHDSTRWDRITNWPIAGSNQTRFQRYRRVRVRFRRRIGELVGPGPFTRRQLRRRYSYQWSTREYASHRKHKALQECYIRIYT